MLWELEHLKKKIQDQIDKYDSNFVDVNLGEAMDFLKEIIEDIQTIDEAIDYLIWEYEMGEDL